MGQAGFAHAKVHFANVLVGAVRPKPPLIEGTVLRRNKVDGKGNHPWKAEVSEDDTGVPAFVISG